MLAKYVRDAGAEWSAKSNRFKARHRNGFGGLRFERAELRSTEENETTAWIYVPTQMSRSPCLTWENLFC